MPLDAAVTATVDGAAIGVAATRLARRQVSEKAEGKVFILSGVRSDVLPGWLNAGGRMKLVMQDKISRQQRQADK